MKTDSGKLVLWQGAEACLECHTEASKQMHKTFHWNWAKEVDGVLVDMDLNFPQLKVSRNGKTTWFVFRFPYFKNEIFYDPISQAAPVVENDPSYTTSAGNSYSTCMLHNHYRL